MPTTRDRILKTLLHHPRSSVNELAAAVGINAISVRHHLTNLEAGSLVASEEERHGVGRPRLVYSLTPQGMERFPTRYFRLTNRLLDQMKLSLPQHTVKELFTAMAAQLAATYAQKAAPLPTEEKLELIKKSLGEEGYQIQWEKIGDQYLIHEISCPYFQVGQSHPEVCALDQTFISTVLSVPVEKVRCLLKGDQKCTFVIPAMIEGIPTDEPATE